MKTRTARAIRRAALIAARFSVASAPLHESEQLLWQKFDGDILKIQHTIAFYDEHDDEIVFNHREPYPGDNGVRFEPVAIAEPMKSQTR
jgi:hypothetical protein